MTSEKKILANRQNALKSTGPTTAAGKAIVAKNAVKHGLCARHIIIDGESSIEFAEFSNSLAEQFQPDGALELLLVNRIIAGFWRLRRLGRVEVELFDHLCSSDVADHSSGSQSLISVKAGIADDHEFLSPDGTLDKDKLAEHLKSLKDSLPAPGKRLSNAAPSSEALFALSRCFRSLLDCGLNTDDANAIKAALQQIDQMSPASEPHKTRSLGHALASDYRSDGVTIKFSRYESHIERSLFRSLHELQRLQAKRHGQDVAPPAAIDIEVA